MGLDNQKPVSSEFNAKAPVLRDAAQQSFGQILSKNKDQFIIIGDTDHGNRDVIGFLAKDQTMAILAQNGIKNLAVEVRKEFQPLAEKVAKGEMTPQQYAVEKSAMYQKVGDNGLAPNSPRSLMEGNVFQAAGKYGIKVLCVEGQDADLKANGEAVDRLSAVDDKKMGREFELTSLGDSVSSLAKLKLSEWTNGAIAPNAQVEASVQGLANYINATDPETTRIKEEHKAMVESRISGDATLAKTIIEQSGGQKTAVFYGNQHGALNNDLDEHLNAKKIDLYANMGDLKVQNQAAYMTRQEMPDYSLDLVSGKAITEASAQAMSLKEQPQIQKQFVPTIPAN